MDNTDTLKEIGPYLSHLPTCQTRQNWDEARAALADTPTQFRDYGYNQAVEEVNKKSTTCSCGLDKVQERLAALSEAYNLGISVSVKEYAVEVLEGLEKKYHGRIDVLKAHELFGAVPEVDQAILNTYNYALSLIESTITQIKSNPSGNIGIHKWIPVSDPPKGFGRFFTIDFNSANPQPSVTWFNKSDGVFEIGGMTTVATHWLPLNSLPTAPPSPDSK